MTDLEYSIVPLISKLPQVRILLQTPIDRN